MTAAERVALGYPTLRRIWIARVAAICSVFGGAVYLWWRSGQLAEVSPWGWLLFAAELLNYLTLVSAIPLMWNPRPRELPPPPEGSLDVLVTVCGEDVEMVEGTLEAALAIEYPHRTIVCNDGRMAGAANWRAIEALCARMGVRCLTRTSGGAGKAGNLNHALAHTDGDFVAVIDADHVAVPTLADDLLGYCTPDVALVTTRQSFYIDDRYDELGNSEAFFYGVVQPSKDVDNAAFSCGNGVVYRREALESIGGFSEWNLVEDMRTSFELHAEGWRTVYIPRSVTRGIAPGTAAEMASQRLRWATDSLRLFFFDNPFFKRGLTFRQRLHYGQTTGIYYLTTATHVVFLLSPILALVFGVVVMKPDSAWHYALALGAFLIPLAVMLVAFAGPRGAVRLVQMQTFLAPVFCVAAWRALRMRPGKRQKAASGVTEKSRQSRLNGITVFQNAMFVGLIIAIGFGLGDQQQTKWGAILWAALLASVLATQNSMVSLKRDTTQSVRIALTVPAVLAAVFVGLAIWSPVPGDPGTSLASGVTAAPQTAGSDARTPLTGTQALSPNAAKGRQKLMAPRTGAYFGAYDPAFADLRRHRQAARRFGPNLRIEARFVSWFGGQRLLDRRWLDDVTARGKVPMITWEPWRKPANADTDGDQRPGLLRDIADGRYDAYIRVWARETSEFGQPLVIRLMHEMNGNWYPWKAQGNDNSPEDYAAAWRHIHRIFELAGANNVSWVFSIDSAAGGPPTPRETLDTYYPGRKYVDWVGVSGFNWGMDGQYPAVRSFADTLQAPYDVLATYGKPVMVSETGTSSSGGDPAAWITDGLASAKATMPQLRALVYFDSRSEAADFRLTPAAMWALRRGVRDNGFDAPLRTRRLR